MTKKHHDQLLRSLENERRYVARELHDGVAQTTLQLGLQAGICRKLLERGNTEMLAKELAQLEERIQLASSQVRHMISDMRPPVIEKADEATLKDFVQQTIDLHIERGGAPVTYVFEWRDDTISLSPRQNLTVIRIIQEALLNIRKHASANEITLTISVAKQGPYISIIDDGIGFDPAEITSRSIDKGGAGLVNMYARAKALDTQLSLSSLPPDGGTEITLIFPK